MNLIIGSDHAGFEVKAHLAEWAWQQGHAVTLVGAQGSAAFNYPAASDEVACAMQKGTFDAGVLICGTGIGVSIRANRYPHIRAALCTSTEMAQLARKHNHANVLCLGARIQSKEQSTDILQAFLETEVDEAERHVKRVQMIDDPLSC